MFLHCRLCNSQFRHSMSISQDEKRRTACIWHRKSIFSLFCTNFLLIMLQSDEPIIEDDEDDDDDDEDDDKDDEDAEGK